MSNKIYTVKFPLEIGIGQVGYDSVTTLKETIEYNLKSTLLTNPGEIISDPDFGVGLKQAIFELPTTELLSTIRRRIISQVSTYIPYIRITNVLVNITPDTNQLNTSIRYTISTSQTQETFNFSVSLTDIWLLELFILDIGELKNAKEKKRKHKIHK